MKLGSPPLFLMTLLMSVFCFTTSFVAAQISMADSALVDQLYNQSKRYWGVNKDSAIFYLSQSENLSNKLDFKRGKAYSLYGYGVVENVMYRQFEYFTKSLQLFEEIHDQFGIGLNLVKIGFIYEQIGEPEKAYDYYQRSLLVKKGVNDYGGIALTLINIGNYYKNKGKLDLALNYFQESLVYRLKVGAHQGIAYAHSNIADVLLLQHHPTQSLTLADSAIYHFSFTNDVNGKIAAFTVKGNSLLELGRNTEAENAFRSIIELPLHTSWYSLNAKRRLINFYSQRGQLKEAFDLQSQYVSEKEVSDSRDYRTATQRLANEFEFKMAEQKALNERMLEAKIISRRNDLENLVIATVVMVVFVILFSGRKRIPPSMANAVLFIGLLLLFEFLLVLTDSRVENITGGEPVLKLLSNVLIALTILPIHQFLEKYIQRRILKRAI